MSRYLRRPDDDEHGDRNEERPDLGVVLDHYQVVFSPSRAAQTAHCPLHADRTPSMSLHLGRGLWKCHSCGRGGDAYTLIMEMEATGFVGARALAATVGLTTANPGGGDQPVSGSRYSGRRSVPARPGNRPGHGGYVPAWRRG